MAIDTLLETLEANGRKRAADILREARAEVRRIGARADREGARRREEVLARRERELRDDMAGEIARLRGEGRRDALEARRTLLERVLEAARERLPSALASDSFRDSLPARLERAVRYLPGDEAVVSCPPALEPAVRAAVESRTAGSGPGGSPAEIEIEPDPDAATGFRLRSPDGRVTVDDTLADRLARRRPELEIGLLQRLEAMHAEDAP